MFGYALVFFLYFILKKMLCFSVITSGSSGERIRRGPLSFYAELPQLFSLTFYFKTNHNTNMAQTCTKINNF